MEEEKVGSFIINEKGEQIPNMNDEAMQKRAELKEKEAAHVSEG